MLMLQMGVFFVVSPLRGRYSVDDSERYVYTDYLMIGNAVEMGVSALEKSNEEQLALMQQMDEAFREVRKHIISEWNKNNEHNLGLTHGRMLILLSENGAMKASALAEALSITGGGVTGIADRLIELGYIQRERSQQDRRSVLLTLTEQGLAVIGAMMEVRRNIMIKLFSGLSNDDMSKGIALFQTMSKNMQNE